MLVSYFDIEKYLQEVKLMVQKGKYRIADREKNHKLFLDYLITEDKCREILLDLCVEDFSEAVHNEHTKFAHEILYIFGKEVELIQRYGEGTRKVPLYIKFNKLDQSFLIVISLHEQEYPLNYRFK